MHGSLYLFIVGGLVLAYLLRLAIKFGRHKTALMRLANALVLLVAMSLLALVGLTLLGH